MFLVSTSFRMSLAVDCEISHVFLFVSLYTFMLTVHTTGLLSVKACVIIVDKNGRSGGIWKLIFGVKMGEHILFFKCFQICWLYKLGLLINVSIMKSFWASSVNERRVYYVIPAMYSEILIMTRVTERTNDWALKLIFYL